MNHVTAPDSHEKRQTECINLKPKRFHDNRRKIQHIMKQSTWEAIQ